jgi:hypothetical protein
VTKTLRGSLRCKCIEAAMMNPMPVGSLQLEVDEVLESWQLLPILFAGHTPRGEHYLVRYTPAGIWTGRWMCAPITERALACVRTGRADLRAVFAHTATGTVEIVTVSPDGRCTESLRLCHDLGDAELPPIGIHLRLCA